MNKSKIVLAATGGVIGVATLAAAFLAWQSWSAVSEARDGGDSGEGLDSVLSRASTLSRKDVYPCAESVKAIEANREKFEEWKEEAGRLVAEGDRSFDTNVTAAAFKEQLLFDAKRISALPGTADGAIVKPGFAFGTFREYILDGKLPPEAQLQKLQRQWDDVVFIFETLANAGVGEVTGLEIAAASAAPAPEQQEPRKGQKKPKRAGKSAKSAKGPPKDIVENYTVQFTSSPDAFVRAVNEFSVTNRFVVVEDFSFTRARDDIKEALSVQPEKKDAPDASPSRRRRARRGEAEKEQAQVESARDAAIRKGVVFDPAIATPLSVVLKLSVRDFGTLLGGDNEEEVKQ